MLDKQVNQILLSGIITSVVNGTGGYILLNMKSKKYDDSKVNNVYINLSIYEDVYNKYKDIIVKDSEIYIKGYINSYKEKDKGYKMFISVIDVFKTYEELYEGRKGPYIRYDPDGVMVWNGKRCESTLLSEEEQLEMNNMIKEITGDINE